MNVLVTGGAGYVGSHTAVELLNSGHSVVIVDNLSNSSAKVIDRIKEITSRNVTFYKEDLLDGEALSKIFDREQIDCVIHFAGLKAVGESVAMPWKYYNNNLVGALNLLKVMNEHGVKNLIFSSSATVYGSPKSLPITEQNEKGQCSNPYGWTKFMIEQILFDIRNADEQFNTVILRYFNPVGAHPSGLIGENPKGVPNNLMPYLTQVAIGKIDMLTVYGNDYDTADGTGVRDYIHVVDLAKAHVKALKKIQAKVGLCVYNLGTGRGYSVLEMINAFQKATGVNIPYRFGERRHGDVAECYASCDKAKAELDFVAELNLSDMCYDAWNFQQKNPNGYE